jgi:PAS domain S-box-containing protein
MVEASALGFLLSSTSLLMLGARAPACCPARQALAIGVAVIGMVAVLGNLYGVEQLYHFAGYSSMALHTGISFVILAAGLLFAAPDGLAAVLTRPGPGAQLVRRLLPAALLVPAFIGLVCEAGHRHGLYGAGMDTAIFALATLLSLSALVLWAAHALNQADATRRATETQLRSQSQLIDQAEEALVIRELGGAIRYWNRGAETLYGWSAAEAIGQRSHVLLQLEGAMLDQIDAQLERTGRWEGELVHTTREGRRVTVECRQTAVRAVDGQFLVLKSDRDISERKRAEVELKQSEARLRAVLDQAPCGITIREMPSGKLLLYNEQAASILSGAVPTLNGVVRYQAVHPDGRPYRREDYPLVRAAERGETVRGEEFTFHRADDKWLTLSVSAAPIRGADGQIIAALAVFNDITERKQADEALRKASEELKRSNSDLEQFAYVASHDLQEPLRAVGGYAKLLQRRYQGKLDAKALEYISGAVEGVVRMEQLILDLLAFSRVGTRGAAFVPTDLNSVVDAALYNLQTSIQSAQATVSRDPLPAMQVDPTQITQLFQNLVGNAIKFRKEEPPKIHIGAKQKDGVWAFSVQDNGIGIDPQYSERIFQIFQRLHTRKSYPGTGIGLAICKKIVERHGGRIWVESRPDHGSTFHFVIPETQVA